jgi:polyhydroxybutyrate depolymerase
LLAVALFLFAVCASARPSAPGDAPSASDGPSAARGDSAAARGECALKPGDQNRTIMVMGKKREYVLHVPKSGAGRPRPLVITLHGGAGSGPNVKGFSLMDPVADANGFIAAYPSGMRGLIGGTWNGGECCGLAMEKGSPDLEFISALIDELAGSGCVDPKRVYATGISNGGMFANHLACDLSDKIAAIAPISAAMMDSSCTPKRPVSVLIYHGTGDKFVPWEGGGDYKGAGATHPFPSVEEFLQTWLKIDRCTQEHRTLYKKGEVSCDVYDQCAEGTAVGLCRIEGGGHSWPGGKPVMTWYIGKTTKDISNEVMWKFFAEHPMP